MHVETSYLEKMQNNNGRKESETESSLQEHQENTIFALHTLLSSVANLSRYLYKNSQHVKNKGCAVVETYSQVILLPFQNVARKTQARSFSPNCTGCLLLSSSVGKCVQPPSQSGLLHLLKCCEGLSSLLTSPGSHSFWNTALGSSTTQPHTSLQQKCSAVLPFHPGEQSRMLKSIIQLHWN